MHVVNDYFIGSVVATSYNMALLYPKMCLGNAYN